MGKVAVALVAALVVVLALVAGYRRIFQREIAPAERAVTGVVKADAHPSLLYGRIATVDGTAFEGRLRWGGDQEAFWGDYFNGAKKTNPWASHVPPERLPKERRAVEFFGIEMGQREHAINTTRLFMARFGDIARVEAHGREVRVTLKSGAAVELDRFSASDFDDGVRVWDATRGVMDLDSLRMKAIELMAAPHPGTAPHRLHGTVRTRNGSFTGFVQWDRDQSLGSDMLDGQRFDTIGSVVSQSRDSLLVTLRDGRETVLAGKRDNSRGVYVDDPRYGRVLVSWDAFERIDFSSRGSGPAYGDFPRGGPLTGSVTTAAGQRIAGRLVYDLDESEVTDTLDAPSKGVDYTVPFGLIASIHRDGSVLLRSGEELHLGLTGDLGKANAGMLVFVNGRERPEYVPWTEVKQIDLDRPRAMYPPLGVD